MRNISPVIAVFFLLAAASMAAMTACLPEQATPAAFTQEVDTTSAPLRAPAAVESINIIESDTFPVEVSVIARGHFSNGCMTVDQIRQARSGSTFSVVIESVYYSGTACPESRVAFEESVTLDVIDLPAGIYVVDVNGLQATFKLQRDNVRDDGNAVLGGVVWHDRCDLATATDDSVVEPAANCANSGDELYYGDGVRSDDEPGIGGLRVSLGAGGCPSMGLATTLTDSAGAYFFSGLTAGDYCLSVSLEQEQSDLPGSEGVWTFPEDAMGQQTITLGPGESKLAVSFGWSPAAAPEEPAFFATPERACTNKALFIADKTIPDDTPVAPGEVFTKTWQLQNLGSCTWDPTYGLVLFDGERMGAPESVPLTVTVPPGEYGDISVTLLAPDTPGVYRGEWKLISREGAPFGVGPGSNQAFWVQIQVVEEEDAG